MWCLCSLSRSCLDFCYSNEYLQYQDLRKKTQRFINLPAFSKWIGYKRRIAFSPGFKVISRLRPIVAVDYWYNVR